MARRCTDRSFGVLPIAAAFIDNVGTILGRTPDAADVARSASGGGGRGENG